MRVCDNHPEAQTNQGISLDATHEHYDLCDVCLEQVRAFIRGADSVPLPRAPKKKGMLERIKDSVKAE